MKAQLLYPDRESDWRWVSRATAQREALRAGWRVRDLEAFRPEAALPWNAQTLTEDLNLEALFLAMAGDADDIFVAVRREMLNATANDRETIIYRQAMLADAIDNTAVLRALHSLVIEGLEENKRHYLGVLTRDYPDTVLRWAIEVLRPTLRILERLRLLAVQASNKFSCPGWRRFFEMLEGELKDTYLKELDTRLVELRTREGVAMSAALGEGARPSNIRLHEPPDRNFTWLQRLLRAWFPSYFRKESGPFSFSIAPGDESAERALREFSNRGIAIAASALGDATIHIRNFFEMVRAETAFYVGCVALHEQLTAAGLPVAMPDMSRGEPKLTCEGLYEPSLGLELKQAVVANDIRADQKTLICITGANQGGKSTLLRAIGVAQLMAQAGMFVPARRYDGSLLSAVTTHYKREEDAALVSGKFDEELVRISAIVDHFTPGTLVLLNESFASTAEREGSDIADGVIEKLRAKGGRIVFVTHLYEYARRAAERSDPAALFLRAERDDKGGRSFHIVPGEPIETSFGDDLYRKIFDDRESASAAAAS